MGNNKLSSTDRKYITLAPSVLNKNEIELYQRVLISLVWVFNIETERAQTHDIISNIFDNLF